MRIASQKKHIGGKHNVKHNPLVDPKKVYLPPLHIKLGLIKNFIKGIDKKLIVFNICKTNSKVY